MRAPLIMVGVVGAVSAVVVTGTPGPAVADGGISLPSVSISTSILPTISLSGLPHVSSTPLPTSSPLATSTSGSGGGTSGSGGSGGGVGGSSGSGAGSSGGGKGGRPAKASDAAALARRAAGVQPMIAGTPAAALLLSTETTPAMYRASLKFLGADRAIAAITEQRKAMGRAGDAAALARDRYHAFGVEVGEARLDLADLTGRSDNVASSLDSYTRQAYTSGLQMGEGAQAEDLVLVGRSLDTAIVRARNRLAYLIGQQNAARADYGRDAAVYHAAQRRLSHANERLLALARARSRALQQVRAAGPGAIRLNQAQIAQSGSLGAQIRAASARLRATGRTVQGTGSYIVPDSSHQVTSPFGMRFHPILHIWEQHTGTDFAPGDGLIRAADRGRVLFTESVTGDGNFTCIDHGVDQGKSVVTCYAHQAKFLVRPGQKVQQGQIIGVVGATGYATGPHLHFEVRLDGAPVDPMQFLP
jgi:murein DD-endopeptidase MepM/ murein hydrolase activator NlpD